MKTTSKPLILIVDDNPQNLQVLGNILYSKGYNISVSSSGDHALNSASKKTPDLILLDIQMPGKDGFEVCKVFKSNPKTKDIPVIFLTAVTDSEKIMRGFELGAVDYITKPFNVGELTARVSTHIELKLAREKLLEVNKTKDKLFSIISHDLRGPAFANKFLLQQIINKYSKFSKDEIFNNLVILHTASESFYEFIETLLLWAKSQWGGITFNPEKLNLKNVIKKNINHSSSSAKNKNIEFKITVADKCYVIADEMMLSTVIINLLSNAVKFSNNFGLIEVEAKKKGKFIEVSIKDYGKGISKSDLTKLFSIEADFLFVGTNNEEGSGLGLILCDEFVKRNGGMISVESVEGKGSTFKFTVPCLDEMDK